MKEFAIPYILENFGVKNPRIIYCRIDKFSSILNNFPIIITKPILKIIII
jgi:hypothetical protein